MSAQSPYRGHEPVDRWPASLRAAYRLGANIPDAGASIAVAWAFIFGGVIAISIAVVYLRFTGARIVPSGESGKAELPPVTTCYIQAHWNDDRFDGVKLMARPVDGDPYTIIHVQTVELAMYEAARIECEVRP